MSGIYWGLSALFITQTSDVMDKPAIIDLVLKCQNPDGGFGGFVGPATLLAEPPMEQIQRNLD